MAPEAPSRINRARPPQGDIQMAYLNRLVAPCWLATILAIGLCASAQAAQNRVPSPDQTKSASRMQYSKTAKDYNQRLLELDRMLDSEAPVVSRGDYRIGPDDLLQISVFEAPEMNREVRVSAGGEISLPLLGDIRAAGLSPIELEVVIDALLRRKYMKDPHVSVFVAEMQSHSVAVFGAVEKPGVFQIRGAKTLIEILSMAQGLAKDAGDKVVIVRHDSGAAITPYAASGNGGAAGTNSQPHGNTPAGLVNTSNAMPNPTQRASAAGAGDSGSVVINLRNLLESGDPRANVLVYPGDIVKVERAGVVYVVGEVRKPGGFELQDNQSISVVQAIALAEGLTRTSATGSTRIIHTNATTGKRTEVRINLKKILSGHAPDPLLRPRDIVFVPNATGRSAIYKGIEAAIQTASGIAVYRGY